MYSDAQSIVFYCLVSLVLTTALQAKALFDLQERVFVLEHHEVAMHNKP